MRRLGSIRVTNKLTREEKVHPVAPGELIIHYDCENEFLVGLVDALIASCRGKRCSLQHSWANDAHTERLILRLPPPND